MAVEEFLADLVVDCYDPHVVTMEQKVSLEDMVLAEQPQIMEAWLLQHARKILDAHHQHTFASPQLHASGSTDTWQKHLIRNELDYIKDMFTCTVGAQRICGIHSLDAICDPFTKLHQYEPKKRGLWIEKGQVVVRTLFTETAPDGMLKQFRTGDPQSSLAILGYKGELIVGHPWQPPGRDDGPHPALRLLLTASCGELIVKTYYKDVHNVDVLALSLDDKDECERRRSLNDREMHSLKWYITFGLLPISEDLYFHRVTNGKKRKYRDALEHGLRHLPCLGTSRAPLPDHEGLREICMILMLPPCLLPLCTARRVVGFLPSREWLVRQALRN